MVLAETSSVFTSSSKPRSTHRACDVTSPNRFMASQKHFPELPGTLVRSLFVFGGLSLSRFGRVRRNAGRLLLLDGGVLCNGEGGGRGVRGVAPIFSASQQLGLPLTPQRHATPHRNTTPPNATHTPATLAHCVFCSLSQTSISQAFSLMRFCVENNNSRDLRFVGQKPFCSGHSGIEHQSSDPSKREKERDALVARVFSKQPSGHLAKWNARRPGGVTQRCAEPVQG